MADINEYRRAYYLKNKDKILARTRKHYSENKDRYNQYSKNHYQKNKETIAVRHKKWVQDNGEAVKRLSRDRYRKPAGYFSHLKKNAKLRNKPFEITKEEFIIWFAEQEKVCGYCSQDLVHNWEAGTSPSVDRKDNDLGYSLDNIVLCCVMCNTTKNKFFSYEEMLQLGSVIKQIIINRKNICL